MPKILKNPEESALKKVPGTKTILNIQILNYNKKPFQRILEGFTLCYCINSSKNSTGTYVFVGSNKAGASSK